MVESFEIPLDPEIQKVRDEWAASEYQRNYEAVTSARQSEYAQKADPIFMQYQRGEATEQEWLDAVQAIKEANPYPAQEVSNAGN